MSISLDEFIENANEYGDFLINMNDYNNLDDLEDMYLDNELKDCLRQSLHYLNEREYTIIKGLFFSEDKKESGTSIGLKLNLTRERVRQIKTVALKK